MDVPDGDHDNEVEIRRLDQLVVIGHAIRRLQIRELVDVLVPCDPRSQVSTGECVEVLVASILLGGHTLYLVDERLRGFDLQVALGYGPDVDSSFFHDDRLSKALDQLFLAGLVPLYSGLVLRAISAYDLDVSVIHADNSTVSLHGAYPNSVEPEEPDDPAAIPHVTYGHSKARRPDMKQVMLNLVASGDGAVPLFGRVASGNRGDSPELRFSVERMMEILPVPEGTLLVADCKAFCVETLALIERSRLQYVTLVPRGVNVWHEVYARFCAEDETPPVLKSKGPTGAAHEWRGRSYSAVYEQKDDGGVWHRFELRALVVDSGALRDRKRPGLTRRLEKERVRLERLMAKLAARRFSCEQDARSELEAITKHDLIFHTLVAEVLWAEAPAKRKGPGRPRKGDEPELVKVWRIESRFEPTPGVFETVLREESTFVLATNVSLKEASDAEILATYEGQFKVEAAFHWAKTPLAVAPVLLKTERRIAALGAVYVVALMAYALLQREIRRKLAAEETFMAGNVGTTSEPTAEVVLRMFQNVFTQRPARPGLDDVPALPVVSNLDTEQVRVLELLGCDLFQRTDVRVATPSAPRKGTRSHRAHARRMRERVAAAEDARWVALDRDTADTPADGPADTPAGATEGA